MSPRAHLEAVTERVLTEILERMCKADGYGPLPYQARVKLHEGMKVACANFSDEACARLAKLPDADLATMIRRSLEPMVRQICAPLRPS